MLIDPLSTNTVNSILQDALDVSSASQKVTASNIANIDTPGYKARKMDFKGTLKEAVRNRGSRLPMAVTESSHIGGGGTPVRIAVEEDTESLSRNDGNNVDLDKEMTNLAESTLIFRATSRFLQNRIRMIKYTLREAK